MLWASVPEAAVDEHRHSRSSEHDVRLTPQARLGSDVDSEAKAAAVKEGTQRSLGACDDSAVASHDGTRSLRRCGRRRWDERKGGSGAARLLLPHVSTVAVSVSEHHVQHVAMKMGSGPAAHTPCSSTARED